MLTNTSKMYVRTAPLSHSHINRLMFGAECEKIFSENSIRVYGDGIDGRVFPS